MPRRLATVAIIGEIILWLGSEARHRNSAIIMTGSVRTTTSVMISRLSGQAAGQRTPSSSATVGWAWCPSAAVRHANPAPALPPGAPFAPSIFLDKNRRDVGESQPKHDTQINDGNGVLTAVRPAGGERLARAALFAANIDRVERRGEGGRSCPW
eukprot:COSAG01_NODE_4064_length_5387_cov_3.329236_5_plen_155_part_00